MEEELEDGGRAQFVKISVYFRVGCQEREKEEESAPGEVRLTPEASTPPAAEF